MPQITPGSLDRALGRLAELLAARNHPAQHFGHGQLVAQL